MARPREYDRDEVLEKAMRVFWAKGYACTSMQDLVTAMGINRGSLYAEFGSKQALFDACLQRFDESTVTQNFGPLEVPDAGLEEIRSLIEFFAASASGSGSGRGCLLCNTAVELGPEDPGGQSFVRRYFDRLSGGFQNALQNAQRAGVVRTTVDPLDESRFLTASVLGIFVMLRAQAAPEVIEGAAHVALQHLDSICAANRGSSR
ncbi:MAG: TetR/AcrR family transcriptional regulator [Armatimonadetes bacterium]|nr:TetR/AcrR family transcriptional regulator [Armatimonadota bacterium]